MQSQCLTVETGNANVKSAPIAILTSFLRSFSGVHK